MVPGNSAGPEFASGPSRRDARAGQRLVPPPISAKVDRRSALGVCTDGKVRSRSRCCCPRIGRAGQPLTAVAGCDTPVPRQDNAASAPPQRQAAVAGGPCGPPAGDHASGGKNTRLRTSMLSRGGGVRRRQRVLERGMERQPGTPVIGAVVDGIRMNFVRLLLENSTSGARASTPPTRSRRARDYTPDRWRSGRRR